MRRWLSFVLACVAANCASFGSGEDATPAPDRVIDDTCVLDSADARVDQCKLAP